MADFTISYLESLSTGELLDLAAKCGVDIPPELERAFIIEELLYLGHTMDQKPDEMEDGVFDKLAVLPRQYNISFIDILIRDPLWAFAFWEIKMHDRKLYENAEDFTGYCLRVIPLKETNPDINASFIVALSEGDSGRYLGFPPDGGRCFKVELCAMYGGKYPVIAESRPFTLPRLIDPKRHGDLQAVYRNPLAKISGVDCFSLVHSEDRSPCPRVI